MKAEERRQDQTVDQLPPSPPTTVAVIESIATGAPHRVVKQSDAAVRVAGLFADPQQRARIQRVYAKTKVATRRMAVDPLDAEFEALRSDPATVRDRMDMFHLLAVPLAVEVAGRALAGLSYGADEVGLLVLVTSTGFIAPGVDVAIVKELGLSLSVSRVVVNFMGCAAAMNAIRIATSYVRAQPGMKAMVVCVELCSVNAVFADDVNDVVTHSLFGDGCAALVVGASQVHEKLEPGRVVVRSSFSRLLEGADDGIVLGVNHNGITCELSENLPDYIYAGVDPVVAEMLQNNGLQKNDIDLWAIHPGWAQDHRGIRAIAGDSLGAGGTQLGCVGPVRQHAERVADLRAGNDGAAGRVGEGNLDGSGIRVRAGRHNRGNAVRHHPPMTIPKSRTAVSGAVPDRVVYRSWMTDNLRWDAMELRAGDIVISAPPKCVTTWTQRLVSLLVFNGPNLPGPLPLVSLWLDLTVQPVEKVVAALDSQRHRRFIKTHTPLDGLVLDERVTYIGVGRDPRDAAVSMLMDHDRMRALRHAAGPPGEPFPPIRRDFGGDFGPLEVLRTWMDGQVTPTDGIASLATILHHFDTVWLRRHQPNVALFHYADYQADLVGELIRLAAALGIELDRERAGELAQHATLDVMRARDAELAPKATDGVWRQDEPFFRAGCGGEWREIFTEAEHRRYPDRVAELAGPELLAWAHRGRRGRDPAA